VKDSLCADVVTYPGIFVDQEFNSHPFAGTTTVARDTIVRAGGLMFGTSWGALTVSGHDSAAAITGVVLQDVDIEDSTYAGLLVIGPSTPVQGLTLDGVTIAGAGSYGIAVAPNASGTATATNVVVSGAASGGMSNGAPGAFTITKQAGDTGW
jgi:hypothetical protein